MKLSTCLLVLLFSLFSPMVSQSETLSKKQSLFDSKAKWTTQDGAPVTVSFLKGTPSIISMVYTSCQSSCPLTMNDMRAIARGLSPEELERVKFGLFSFDSETDTPEHLKQFATHSQADLKHWTFFHGQASSVRELAALLSFRFKKLGKADFDHSNIITVLDSEGKIVHQQIGIRQDPKETISVIKGLLK